MRYRLGHVGCVRDDGIGCAGELALATSSHEWEDSRCVPWMFQNVKSCEGMVVKAAMNSCVGNSYFEFSNDILPNDTKCPGLRLP